MLDREEIDLLDVHLSDLFQVKIEINKRGIDDA